MGLGSEIHLFVNRVRSQVDRRNVGWSSKTHGTGYGFALSPPPLARSRDDRHLRTLIPSELDGRKGALKPYPHHVGEELAWGFQSIEQDTKAKNSREDASHSQMVLVSRLWQVPKNQPGLQYNGHGALSSSCRIENGKVEY